ncbi:MAG TPA: endonuclease/exonuclease/phosphatase family protein [Gaiellaceae bacterium]|nr:endonuclease/exonuclease/phosphatase family protein [Gaiellaceae bacterium]HWJ45626.1 endonuclease/exonuclease/phosphatase family protein [Gaiellaceae bacterium]
MVVRGRERRGIRERNPHGSTVERLLVRTWNLFHGKTNPPGPKAFLEEMVRLVTADAPDVVCLQEVPVWATSHLEHWSGMTAVADVARRPWVPTVLGRILSAYNALVFRSAVTGQADALLLRSRLAIVEHRRVVLNPFRFRRAQGHRMGLPSAAQFHWAKERRVCQAVRVRHDEKTFVVGNLHATGYPDKRLADAELLRAAVFVDGLALPDEPVLLAGDFNLSVKSSRTLADLMTPEWGFSGATPTGIDHVLVRGFRADEPHRWPDDRRRRGNVLLSDHAPVEVEVE